MTEKVEQVQKALQFQFICLEYTLIGIIFTVCFDAFVLLWFRTGGLVLTTTNAG